MASPQTENGFTKIANELFDELIKIKLLGSEFQIVYFVIRKTYGFNKKIDRISLTQFEKGTGLSRPTVVKGLKNLVDNNILLCNLGKYSINKNYDLWGSKAGLTSKSVLTRTSKHRLTKNGKARLTHKRQKTMKDNIAKDKPLQEDIVLLIEEFSKINPACNRMYGNKTQRLACEDLITTYGKERIINIIQNTLPKTNKIKFFPTITTPLHLRDKFVSLESAIIRYKKEQPKNKVAFY